MKTAKAEQRVKMADKGSAAAANGIKVVDPASYSSRTVRRALLKDVWELDRRVFLENFLYTVFFVLFSGLSVYMTEIVLNYLTGPNPSVAGFGHMILIFLAVAGVSGFFSSYFTQSSMSRLVFVRAEKLQQVYRKLHKVDYYYTEDTSFQSKLGNALHAFDSNNNGYEGILNALYRLTPHLVLSLLFLIYLSTVNLFILAAVVANALVLFQLKKKASDVFLESQEERNQLERQRWSIEEVVQDAEYGKDLRMYSLARLVQSEVTGRLRLLLAVMKREKRRSNRWLIPGALTVFASDAVAYGLLLKHFFDGGAVGQLVMVFSLMTRLAFSLESVQTNATMYYDNLNEVRDYLSFMDTDYGHEEREGLKHHGTPTVEFKDVSFAYPGSDKKVLKHVSLTIRPGERIGIVGTNGAGKTTLIKLMLGFYPITEGDILIDGHPVQDYASEDLYNLYNVVFQNPRLYGFTVEENITMTDAGIDEEKVLRALAEVEMKDKILSLKHGLKQPVLKVIDDEGVEFSGGETQKLSIARALYKGGDFMILDEPTSALDALNEAKVYENYNHMVKDKSAIFVSHRLASTRFCDRILFFDDGRLLESGTHESLMAEKGRYYEMFQVQSKYYRDEQEND